MAGKDSALTNVIWRFAPLATAFIWLVDYIFRIYTYGIPSYQYMIITPESFFIPVILVGVMVILTIFFPYQFYIHGILCLLLGLIRLIDGGLTNALLIHLFGYIFLYRQGFFKTHGCIKLSIGGIIIIAAIASQARFEDVVLLPRLVHFIGSILIIAVTIILLKPEIQIIKKKKRKMVLTLPADLVTEKDAEILIKILAGEKYEAIANDEDLSLSTLKKNVRRLFNILRVNDRINFISLYANHEVVIE